VKEAEVLLRALRAAGKVLTSKIGKVTYKLKGRANLLTEADLASQKACMRVIRQAFPDDGFLAEESPAQYTPNGRLWIIDPLDGTTNYAHTFPAAAVSIGFAKNGRIEAGGVYDPFRKEEFTAVRGRGAFLNGRRLRVSRTPSVSKALLVTGFAYARAEKADFYLGFFGEFMKLSHDVRRMGAASLDMCWLAAGRTDGYWEFGLKPWDVAAGKLILEEAGGRTSDFSGKAWKVGEKLGFQTLATNGRLHREMLRVIRRRLRSRA
jgi:myo-inositol-1(or 4)-monophosphatase